MIVKEIRKLENKEIYNKLSNLYKELFNINFHKKIKAGEGLSKRGEIKRSIAVLKTILKEREISEVKGKKS